MKISEQFTKTTIIPKTKNDSKAFTLRGLFDITCSGLPLDNKNIVVAKT